jgi:hypothetical protein
MARKRERISDGATFEELQDLILKIARQMRDMPPPPHVVSTLDRIESQVAKMKQRGKAIPALV